jgi:hypothetical protein
MNYAQVANYTFSESAGTYTSEGGTTAHASGWDDAVTTNTIPLGFTFNFNGTNYTTCSINSNGYITFGATLSANNLFTPISSGTGYNGTISAIGFDLISNASTITYTTTGSAPNRIFIAQWNNARRYSGGAIAGDFNFQIRLNETTNIINIVYGACAPATNTVYSVQVGLRGTANTDFNNRSLTSNTIWDNNTTAGGANNSACRTRSNAYPNTGRTFTWTPPPPPTITSLGVANGCVGSSLTITGANLTGATLATIGGTAATITGNTATTVTVTVGNGTTGTVQITTPSGSATSAATFTVNPTPAAIAGGASTVCPGANTPAFTNGVGGGTWSITNGTGSATISAGGVATGVTAGTVTVVYSIGTCTASTALTVNPLPATVTTPTPTDGATGVCYAGGGAVSSISWGASAGATSYDVYFGAGSVPGSVTATVLTNSYTTGALAASTTYFWRIVAKNACGNAITSATFSLTTAASPCALAYCTPTFTTGVEPISNVTFNTINNNSANVCGAGLQYENFSATSTTVIKSSIYSLSVTGNTCGAFTNYIRAYVDWNIDGDFLDAGESFDLGTIVNTTTGVVTLPITIPAGANTGTTRMRIMKRYNAYSTDACQTGAGYGQAEDYTLNIIDPSPCLAPTAQPTALALTAQATILSGSFTAASPAPDNYLVVMSTNPVAPAGPVNGTTYAIGSTIAAGYTVVDNDSNTSFSVTGLTSLTTYYFYIYSFNSLCSGGPLYLIPSPLTGNVTTGLVDYCIPTSTTSTRYIDDVSTTGYITNITNMTTGRAATGYADYTAIPPVTQIPGGGVTLDYRLAISRQFVKVWVDWNNDGTFTDAAPELVYTTGGVQTIAGSAGFVIPGGTLPGNYRIRMRSFEASQTFGPCGNLATGEAEDYRLTVVADCAVNITSVVDGSRCDTGTVNVTANGTAGTTQYRYYSARTGGSLVGTSATTSWTTPSISANTSYYVTAWNGTCESWYRTEVKAIINPTTTINVTPSTPEVCGENNVVTIAALGDVVIDYLVDESFEGGGFGVLTRTNVAADANTQWTNRTSPYVPTGAVWKPAITSRTIGNRFALAVSDFAAPAPKDTQIRTVVLNTTAYSDLYLSFRHYFSYYVGEPLQFADVDVSTNGGGAWTNLASYTSTQGFAGQFNDVVINASAYAGLPSVMFRFRYQLQGSAWCDGWAIDDVKVYGTRPLNTTFSWSGGVQAFIDLACTIPYVAQSVSTIYVKPTAAQLELPSYSFTASATLGNGCPVSKLISITNKSSVWKGSTNNDWNNPNNWSPVGVPTINTCVIIPDVTATNPSNILGANYNAFGKTLQVKNLGNLQIQPTNTLTIADYVEVTAGGIFNIENSGSLIQINNNVNTGIITMKRNAVTSSALDYVYWSTPVAGFSVNSITPSSIYRYMWNPTTVTGYTSNFGNWASASGAMTNGRGYIIRGSSGISTFSGVPNNGNITIPITRSTYVGAPYVGPTTTMVTADDDNWNLLGNPYPSAINAVDFLAANSANINGFVKIWTHGTAPGATAQPFYQNYVSNYTTADYITYNNTGGTQSGFDGKIGAGQGFFVLMNNAASTTENAVFNNTMRSNAHRNDQFYRSENGIERNRIWLDLISPSSTSITTLVGYVSNATNNLDNEYDAIAQGIKTNFEIYSIAESQELIIQGRSLPFNQNDEVILGVSIPQNGIYTIAISNADGLFGDTNQNIYLEDKQLGIIHDLKTAPYTFTGIIGRDEDRFVLLYNSSRLSQDDVALTNNLMVVSNEDVTIYSSIENIKSIQVHDLLGRIIKTYQNIDSTEFKLNNLQKNNSTLLLKIELNNGIIIDKKIIY